MLCVLFGKPTLLQHLLKAHTLTGVLCAPQQRSRGVPKTALAMSAPMILEEDTEPMTMEDAIEELFGAVVTAADHEQRLYSYDFRLLPSKQVCFKGVCFVLLNSLLAGLYCTFLPIPDIPKT